MIVDGASTDRLRAMLAPHYEVSRLLARGSADLFLGRDPAGDEVVIKVLPPAVAPDAECRWRFLQEAQITAALDHPCVVRIVDSGRLPDGRLYHVLPHFDAPTLAARIRAVGPLSVEETLAILEPLADVLALAHGKQIVHRDLKPTHVVLPPGRLPRLIDWGSSSKRGADHSVPMRIGASPGSLGYAPPEALAGAPVDGRGDIYSLGVLAFEMLTGSPLFPASSLDEARRARTRVAKPYVSERRPAGLPGVPPVLEVLVDRMTAVSLGARVQTMAEVRGTVRMLRRSLKDPSAPAIARAPRSTPVEDSAVPIHARREDDVTVRRRPATAILRACSEGTGERQSEVVAGGERSPRPRKETTLGLGLLGTPRPATRRLRERRNVIPPMLPEDSDRTDLVVVRSGGEPRGVIFHSLKWIGASLGIAALCGALAWIAMR